MTLDDYLRVLHPGDGWRDMRAISGKKTIRQSFPTDRPEKVAEFIEWEATQGMNIFVGVSERGHPNGGGLKDCTTLPALFVDVDFKDTPEDEAIRRLAEFPLETSIVNNTGGGYHGYWLLREPVSLQDPEIVVQVRGVLVRLADLLRGDRASATPERILRVPGTKNFKYDPPRDVVIEKFDENIRYTLDEIVAVVGPLPETKPEPEPEPFIHNQTINERVRAAKSWLTKREPAIEGNGGDNHTYETCCAIVIGFDLPEQHALAVLRDWNQRCQPPWDNEQLAQKVRNAEKYGTGQRGEKLRQSERTLTLTPAASMSVRPVQWLWHQWVPAGALSLLAGREGIGKSLVTIAMIADITRGTLHGQFRGIPRSVIIAATEDSWSRVILPRLLAAGANLSLVFRVDVVTSTLGASDLVLPTDVGELKRLIVERGDVALIVLDPLLSRLARKLDSNKDQEVRQGIEPIALMADETGVSIIGIIHVNKSGSIDPLNSIMASRAFPAISRAVLFATIHPNDQALRLLGNPKENFGESNLPSKIFRIESVFVDDTPEGKVYASLLKWQGETPMSIRDALQELKNQERGDTELGRAKTWLHGVLSRTKEMYSDDLKKAAAADGISESTLKRAKRELHVDDRRVDKNEFVWFLRELGQ